LSSWKRLLGGAAKLAASTYGNVGTQQLEHYSQTGDPAALERAIEAFEQGVEQSQSGDPNLPGYLTYLGLVLRMRGVRMVEQ